MLKGFFKKDGIVVDLNGYDIADNFNFYLSCPILSDIGKLDGGITILDSDGETTFYAPRWEELYLGIGSGAISVSCYTEKEDGKKYKNAINVEYFKDLGSIIRGMKSACNTSNREDALEALSGMVSPNKTANYVIEGMGTVSISMCNVVKMHYLVDDVELLLEEDYNFNLKVNKLTREQHKIQLDLSGFIPEAEQSWVSGEVEEVFSLSEIIERNPEKSYVWLKERKYTIVNTREKLEKVCKEIWNHDGIVCFDTETTGLNFTFKCFQGIGDRLVGMVFSIREGEAWYFPVAHKAIDNICTPENEKYIIEKYFKPILEKKPILCHNGSFDWKVMYTYKIFMNLVHDTLIFYKLTLWNDNRGLLLNLKNLTHVLLNRDSFELSDFVSGKWGKGEVNFSDLPYESVKYYACPDTDNTLGLFNYGMKNQLLEQYGAKKIYEIEVAFSVVIAYQEFYGHCADVEKSEELAKELIAGKERAYKAMVDIVGHDFNPRSSPDMQKVFFQELGYPVIDYTDTGAPSAGKKFIKALIDKRDENGDLKYPVITHYKDYKDYAQLESNFIKNLGKFATQDGFMFSHVKQFLETGRISVSDPNYQSYNDTVKKYIIPRTGYYMMDSDYSSVEYRILSCMAQQQNLIKAFFDPDTDYHTLQASRMFKVPYELVTKKLRSLAKGINFGLPYGMADPSLGEHLYGVRSAENTLKARKMREVYFDGQDDVRKFFVDARANGVRNGYGETFFGRRRYFDRRKVDKGSIERQAGNFRIQGTAADLYKIAMVRLLSEIRKRDWVGKVLISGFIHDECLLEIHKSIDPMVMLKVLKSCMMIELDGWCPLYNGAGFGINWYNAKKTEIPIQVQDYMCEHWGEAGLDWWDGDTDKLYDWEVGLINDYKKDRVIDYLKKEENWGKTLAPVENGFAHEVIEEIQDGHNVHGVVNKDVHTDKDTVDNLEQFCICFGIEDLFKQADIQRPVYKEESGSDLVESEEEEEPEVSPLDVIMMKVRQLGVGLDTANKKVYIRYDNDVVLMNLISKTIKNYPGTFEVLAVKEDGIYTTNTSMDLKGYSPMLMAYMSRRNAKVVK